MTHDKAAKLKPGDRVRIANQTAATGTVITAQINSVSITWDSGATWRYRHDAMPHIYLALEATHDPC